MKSDQMSHDAANQREPKRARVSHPSHQVCFPQIQTNFDYDLFMRLEWVENLSLIFHYDLCMRLE